MKIFVNILTGSRLIFTIILMLFFKKITNINFLIWITFLFFSDFLDGFLARKFRVQSFFGSFLDTFADKVLNITLILPLINLSKLFYLLIGLEIIILIINLMAFLFKKSIHALLIGKIKMWVIYLVVIMGYISLFKKLDFNLFFIYIIIGLEILVVVSYLYSLIKGKNISTFKFQKNNIRYCLFDTNYYLENK